MQTSSLTPSNVAPQNAWLKSYYFARAAFSIVWVAAAFTVGKQIPGVAAALLLAYPAWDAAANLADAMRNGGLKKNPPQALNALVSAVTAIAVAIALGIGMNAVLIVFGVWASLSGVFQLATGVRRWKRNGAQWAMILSGAQSAIAGTLFIQRGRSPVEYGIAEIAPYAAFGAFYFLVSAVSLALMARRRRLAGG